MENNNFSRATILLNMSEYKNAFQLKLLNICITFLFFFPSTKCSNDDVIASTQYGQIQGKTKSLANGQKINIFLGIPYATPPIGSLRFEVIEYKIQITNYIPRS